MFAPSIDATLLRAERRLVKALDLRSRSLQPRLAQASGLWKDAPVTITTRVYDGDAVGYMRVATIAGTQLTLGSLLVCARPNRGLPLFSGELVSRGLARETAVTVDVVPMTDTVARGESHPAAFQKTVGNEQLAGVLAAFDASVDAWITLTGAMPPSPDSADAVRRRQHEYTDARRADPRTRSLLVAMFGAAWADDYLRSVLFPA